MLYRALILFSILLFQKNSYAQRYLNPIFTSSTVTNNIQYGQAPNYKNVNENLQLDFYEPSGDTITKRPLIIYCHGGGFTDTNQSKSLIHIVAYCDSMARRGYAVASINYRLDTSISNRAIVNAMHDAKAAVRFFRANATQFKIDTSTIFIGGESAGCITAFNCGYMDKISEVNYPPTLPLAMDNSVEGNSGSAGFSSSVKAILFFCGGTKTILNELLIDTPSLESNSNIPLLIVHGTADNIIPVSRSIEIATRANNISVPNLFYTFNGATHCPWFFPLTNSWSYLDTLVNYTTSFLYPCIPLSTKAFSSRKDLIKITLYPNPAYQFIHLDIDDFKNKTIQLSISRLNGQVIYHKILKSNLDIIKLDVSPFKSGQYFINITINNQVYSETFIRN